jgi:hypothetical protein
MSIDETGLILAFLATIYPPHLSVRVDAATIKIWQSLLSDLPYAAINSAVKAWVATNKYPPTIADLRAMLTPAEQRSPEEAWSLLYSAIKKGGFYDRGLAQDIMGDLWCLVEKDWSYYAGLLEEDVPNEKSRFLKMYAAFVHREKVQAQIPAILQKQLEDFRRISANERERLESGQNE